MENIFKEKVHDLPDEVWEELIGSDSKIMVSNLGRVKREFLVGEKLLSLHKDRCGYVTVNIYLKGSNQYRSILVHRLVALLFVPNPCMYKEVNHKDGNKENNRYDNLEWCTRSENIKHAFALGLKRNAKGSDSSHAKTFYQFDKNGNLIRKWGSLVECADYLAGLDPENGPAFDIRKRLSSTLHDRHKSCCGFLFSFEDHIDSESKLAKNCIPVIATLVVGKRGHKVLSEKPEDTIRFRYLNETEGYVMPNGQVACATLVSKCCKGKRDTHVGYKWRYEESDFHIKEQKPILQYDLDWNLIKVWTCGVMGIAEELGLATYSGISMCLNSDNKNKTCAGYHWRYDNATN